MDSLLTTIGVLGFGAFLIASWVFMTAARSYLTGESRLREQQALESDLSPYRPSSPNVAAFAVDSAGAGDRPEGWVDRAEDRRQNRKALTFPATINGVLVEVDRRVQRDRRRAALA